jgi:transcriptional regulator with XRE-family HTH domain
MTQEELKKNFSTNLIKLRKTNNLTQLALAEKLNYSDKAISKWEVGSVIPDVETMTQIADFFGITVNDLIYTETKKKYRKIFWQNHLNITGLSIGLAWFIATIVFFVLQEVTDLTRVWLTFIITIPVSFIILVVLSSLWFGKLVTMISVSGLAWSIILTIFLTFNTPSYWFLFVIGIVGQLLIIFWSQLKKIVVPHKQSKKSNEK